MADGALGWRPYNGDKPWQIKYALAPELPRLAAPAPVVIGVNWYAAFDKPARGSGGAHWIGAGASWGSVRGGHAVCIRPPAIADLDRAWRFFDQGPDGACVGFAASRAASLMNRRLYDGRSCYLAAQRRDPWPGSSVEEPRYEGTTVEAGCNTLRLDGAWPVRSGVVSGPSLADGIARFYWATSVDQIMQALGTQEPFARILNSWGAAWPREVRMPWEAIDRLMREGGEFAALVDRR